MSLPVSAAEKIIFIERNDEKKFYQKLFQNIRERKVCLISNQAASGKYLFVPSQKGYSSYFHEMMAENHLSLYKVFSPEHGLSSQSESTGFETDRMLIGNIPVLPAYHKTFRELQAMFGGCEAILFDLPDAGVRPYTYRTILSRSVEAVSAMQNGTKFYLIDRENPASIYPPSGPVVRMNLFSYLGEQSIPFFPSYTYAELIRYYIRQNQLDLAIRYIAIPHYRPGKNPTKNPMDPPSPSLPHVRALHCYWIGIFLEGTALDYGRFSKDPFCMIGHPQINYKIDPPQIPGVTWSKHLYKPFSGPYQNILLRGYKMEINDITLVNPVQTAYQTLAFFLENYPEIPLFTYGSRMYAFDKIVGSSAMRESLMKKTPYEKWKSMEDTILNRFIDNMKNYRVY